MTEKATLAMADQLRQYAEHFAQRDWNYTRKHDVVAIRYAYKPYRSRGDGKMHRDYDHPISRIRRVIVDLGPWWASASRRRNRDNFVERMHREFSYAFRLKFALTNTLRRDKHLPDGVLDNGGIITHWEETGEYLQYVQPSVGSLIADWMEAEPDNPHAQRVAAEMKRVNDAYGERIKAGEVD